MNLEEFFEAIDLEAIDEFIGTDRLEDLHLEFKTVDYPGFKRDDRRSFAKALSGFANSDGGIVAWGVDCRRLDGVDAACGKKPIDKLSGFISDLNSFVGQFVTPVVDGVLNVSIPQASGDVGFAKSLIPRSESTPHMAKGGEDRYYKRSGDSFRRMEHFDVADMFGRRPQPKLEFMADCDRRPERVMLVVGLKNAGRGLARFPYLSMHVEPPYQLWAYGLDGNGNTGLPRTRRRARLPGSEQTFGGGNDFVVYPDGVLEVTQVVLDRNKGLYQELGGLPDFVAHYSICCEGMPIVQGVYRFSVKYMQEMEP